MSNSQEIAQPEMTPERWARLKVLFIKGLDLDPKGRSLLVAEAEESDPPLAAELKGLLARHTEQNSTATAPFLSKGRLLEYFGAGVRAFQPGDVLCDRFRIERFIGEGGMGEVYSATDLDLGVVIAVKTLRPTVSTDAHMLASFKHEIQLARKVTHPNVCRTFDVIHHKTGTQNDIAVLTMEYLAGETLYERIRRDGPFETNTAWPIIQQIAEGLTAAHCAGVIHRDFKSSNVILVPTAHGSTRAVVTDFGLAREHIESMEVDAFDDESFAGTPAYIAPEQLLNKPLTPAVDVYAFGIVLFEMLTGRLPFEGSTVSEIANRRLEVAAPSPKDFVPDVERKWSDIIRNCLELDPKKRPQSPRDVSSALRPQTLFSRRKVLAIAASGALLTIPAVRYFATPRPLNPAALTSLKRAQEFARRRTKEGLENALLEYKQAAKYEPNEAEIWVGIADAYSAMANFEFMEPRHALKEARQAAQHAISLDSRSGRAHAVLAYCMSNDLQDWINAEREFGIATRLAPRDPDVRLWYAAHLGRLGRSDAAIEQLKIGLTEDPAALSLNQQLATELFLSGRTGEFFDQATELIRLQPFEATAHLMLARALEQQGRYDEALQSCKLAETYHHSMGALCLEGSIEASRGNTKRAWELANSVRQFWTHNPFESLLLAALYCRLQDSDKAIDVLLVGCERGDSSVLLVPRHPYLALVRTNPKYPLFLQKIHLA